MAQDLNHWWGGDLSLTPSGDLSTVDRFDKDNQRIVRRLCTNGDTAGAMLGEYAFHPDYGGSAPWYVGQTQQPDLLEAIIRSQMYEEASVSHNPEPTVDTVMYPNGSFVATIQYTDEESGQLLPPLTFQVE